MRLRARLRATIKPPRFALAAVPVALGVATLVVVGGAHTVVVVRRDRRDPAGGRDWPAGDVAVGDRLWTSDRPPSRRNVSDRRPGADRGQHRPGNRPRGRVG